ncbi:trypsin-like peptidase domain-containing protein [Jatrophihabitans sp.]|uniref:trypsin-like peptidase domain-containing protein n=1 Tax=Jatrophihabitans sp. TaxID=1932789 RepID=UPI0030C73657|nr:hypothetical protein [Jatrophihabitans sp.]
MANSRKLSTATATLMSDGYGTYWLVTNWHVLSGRNPITGDAMHSSGATPEQLTVHMTTQMLGIRWPITIPLRDEDGDALWMEHPTRGKQVDVAAVPLPAQHNQLVQHWINPTDDSSPIWIAVSERLSVVGFPFGITAGLGLPIWTQGFVASHIELDFDGSPCFLIDARTREGQSGSPVVYYSTSGMYPVEFGGTQLGNKGETRFLGIYSGRINIDSDLGRVWKPSAITDIITGNTKSKAL